MGSPVWGRITGPQAQHTAGPRQVAAAGHVTQAVRACGTTTSALLHIGACGWDREAASAPSSLHFGVEPLQFHAGVFDAELPAPPILSLEGTLEH